MGIRHHWAAQCSGQWAPPGTGHPFWAPLSSTGYLLLSPLDSIGHQWVAGTPKSRAPLGTSGQWVQLGSRHLKVSVGRIQQWASPDTSGQWHQVSLMVTRHQVPPGIGHHLATPGNNLAKLRSGQQIPVGIRHPYWALLGSNRQDWAPVTLCTSHQQAVGITGHH